MDLKRLSTNGKAVLAGMLSLAGLAFAVLSLAQSLVETPGQTPVQTPMPTLESRPGVMLVLDASGSMEGRLDGQSKIALAREASGVLARGLAAEGLAMGPVTFGVGSASCSSAQVAVPVQTRGLGTMLETIQTVRPTYRAKTPLLAALRLAAEQVGPDGHVIAVIDGMDTCQLNPCDLPSSYFDAKTKLVLIGLNVGTRDESHLKCLAAISEGTYLAANSKGALETLSQVTAAMVSLSSKLHLSQTDEHRSDQLAGAELLQVQQQRDRALIMADEMRDRQQALVALIDQLKLKLNSRPEPPLLTNPQITHLTRQYVSLEDLSSQQAGRIAALEAEVANRTSAHQELEHLCRTSRQTIRQCQSNLSLATARLDQSLEELKQTQQARETEITLLSEEVAELNRALSLSSEEQDREQEKDREQEREQAREQAALREQHQQELANLRAVTAEQRQAERAELRALEQRFADLSAIYEAIKDDLFRRDAEEETRVAETKAELDRLKGVLEQVRADQNRLRSLLTQQDSAQDEASAALRQSQRALTSCLIEAAAAATENQLLAEQLERSQSDLDSLERSLSNQEVLIENLISSQLACVLPVRVAEGEDGSNPRALDQAAPQPDS